MIINNKIYNSYVELCKKLNKKPNKKKSLDYIIYNAILYLIYNKKNYTIINEDDIIYIYIGIKEKNIVINFWNEIQKNILVKEDLK